MPFGHVNPGTNAGARRDRLTEGRHSSGERGLHAEGVGDEEEGLGAVSGGEVQRETGGSP